MELHHARLLCPSLLPGVCPCSQMHVHLVSDAIQPSILFWPLLLLPSVFPSIRVFSNELALCIRWPKYWSFSFSISPSSEYSGLISFWIDWFDLLDVQGTLKSLLQHHNSKASILRRSAFLMVQLSHRYIAGHTFWGNRIQPTTKGDFTWVEALPSQTLPRALCILTFSTFFSGH